MHQRVIIVGGGLAGLAAAAALGPRGFEVSLLESRPRWGRASSFVDNTTGETIDNCQHVSMGCCTNFDFFCRTVGVAECFHCETELSFVGPNGAVSKFSAVPLPAPLHLFPALLRLRFLSLRDKWKLAWGLRALARTSAEPHSSESFADWLKRHHQPTNLIDRFWHVVLVSALSESLDRIDVAHARKVFVDGFLRNSLGWQVRLPSVPLDQLYGSRLETWLQEHRVTMHLQCGLKRAVVENGRATGVELRNGDTLAADHVVLAVPQNIVLSLLPEECADDPQLRGISQLETAPISSVHLWFDRPITELHHATIVGKLSQWLFNRSAIQGTSSANGHYYQVVISASRDLVQRPQVDVIRQVVAELAAIWPVAGEAHVQHARLVTEHKAVVSMTPGVERLRPLQQSPYANLQLAGDWTNTGWPSTMEGAVRSGFLAAENILRHCGNSDRILQPDLPTARLSKLLFGL